MKNMLKRSIVFVVEGLCYHPRARWAVGISLLILSYPLSWAIDHWILGLNW